MKNFAWLFIFMFLCATSYANIPPPASEVFHLTAKPIDPNTFSLTWQIKKGFLLYKDRILLKESDNSNSHLGTLAFPVPFKKALSNGKETDVYREEAAISVSVLGKQPGESLITVSYQGCADDGFCYPPQTQSVKLSINDELALTNATVEASEAAITPKAEIAKGQGEKLTQLFATSNWALILLSFFGFGLLLSFTPCVLPMVPVLSGIIVGHGHNLSTRKAFLLSLAYVLSMSITYAIVGAVVAKMGSNLQLIMQSSWAISLFSLIFVALALSMFGFYELRLPVSFQANLARITRSHSTGHYLGAALMGCLSTLILSPCVTAPLIGALGYIAQSGNVILGSLSLFFLSLGMGMPLLLIGASAGKLLPKAGLWMNAVKGFFGVLLLAIAIYLLERLLPSFVIMWLWASLLIFSGIYAGAFTKGSSHPEQFSQGLGLILLVYGFLILIGAAQNHSNPLLPLVSHNEIQTAPAYDVKKPETAITVTSPKALQEALTLSQGKPVMLDFYADWCASCKKMERTTLKTPRVLNALDTVVVIKVDITANDTQSKELLNHYKVIAPPTFLFLGKNGDELNSLRLVGEVSPKILASSIRKTYFSFYKKT